MHIPAINPFFAHHHSNDFCDIDLLVINGCIYRNVKCTIILAFFAAPFVLLSRVNMAVDVRVTQEEINIQYKLAFVVGES